MKIIGAIAFLSILLSIEKASAREFVIERFSPTATGNIPDGWKLLKKKGKPDFAVVEESGNHVLRLRSIKSSFRLEKYINVDYQKYPIATWRWKVVTLPKGGDVCNKKTDDQAAQIYFCFSERTGWLRNRLTTDLLGYIWENLAPALTTQISRSWPKIRYYVLHNGKEKQKIGQWVTERANVVEDYKAFFGKRSVPKHLFGIALMIDSDNTSSSAESYFDDIVFQSQ